MLKSLMLPDILKLFSYEKVSVMKNLFIKVISNIKRKRHKLDDKSKFLLVSAGIMLVGAAILRLYHINMGLPHSLIADEPEIGEFAVKYTYEIRDIVGNNNWYKLIPVSYVYGTLPVYINSAFTMIFSKSAGLLGISFDKTDIYTFLRIMNSLVSLAIIPAGAFLYKKIFKDSFGTLVTFFLLAFNWKLIVHSHYLNVDILVSLLLTLAFFDFNALFGQKT